MDNFLGPWLNLLFVNTFISIFRVRISDTASGICKGSYTANWDRWRNEKGEEGLTRPLVPVDREEVLGLPQEIVMLCQTHWLKVTRQYQGNLHMPQHPHVVVLHISNARTWLLYLPSLTSLYYTDFHPEWSFDFRFLFLYSLWNISYNRLSDKLIYCYE